MLPDLGKHVDTVEQATPDGLDHRPWDLVAPMRRIAEEEPRTASERMRPLPAPATGELKTAVLFGCAEAMGTVTGCAGPRVVDQARFFGGSLGIIYQMADDYLDVFGAGGALGRRRASAPDELVTAVLITVEPS